MKLRFIFIFIVCTMSAFGVFSQTTGRVLDSKTKETLSYVQVVALSADSTVTETTLTNDSGRFTLSGTPAIVSISSFGYSDKILTTDGRNNLGDIFLEATSIELKEVVATHEAPTTRIQGNSLITKVEGTTLATLNDALQVLGWIPMVSQINGAVSVFGRGTPLIYINGRKLYDMSELNQLEASDIKDVRVITNPGAQYGSTVKSVIIIRTKKRKGDGWGLAIRGTERLSDYVNSTGIFNVFYRNGGFDVIVRGMAQQEKQKFNSDNVTETYLPSKTLTEKTDHAAVNTFTKLSGNISLNYQFNENHSIGAYYSYIAYKNHIKSGGVFDISIDNSEYESLTTNGLKTIDFYPTQETNLYYNGTIDHVTLDFNMNYYGSKPNLNDKISEISSIPENNRTVSSYSNSINNMVAQKFTATYRINRSELEVGEEFTNSHSKSNYLNYENILPDNVFKVKEKNIAPYVQFSQGIGKNFSVYGGLRYEHVVFDYYNNGVYSDASRTYDNFFPSGGASFGKDNFSASFSYSHKTSRPSFGQINSSVRYVNKYEYQQGNPLLKPSQTESFNLMAIYKDFYMNLTLQNQRDAMMWVEEPYKDSEDIYLYTCKNISFIRYFSAMLGYNGNLCDKLRLQLSTGMNKQWFTRDFCGEPMSFNKPTFTVNCLLTIKLPYGINFMPMYTFNSRGFSDNFYTYGYNHLGFIINKSFDKGWRVSIEATDLLNDLKQSGISYDSWRMSKSKELMNARRVEISVQYNLNPKKGRYKGKNAGKDARNRIKSNGI